MDLRDLVRNHPEAIVGHTPLGISLNLKKELRRFANDPMSDLLNLIDSSKISFIIGDIERYLQAYSRYALSLERALIHCSVSRSHDQELRYHPHNKEYSARQKKLALKWSQTSRFLELDYQNLIIHACILLDRTITLSRRFLTGNQLPSFTSFSKHKGYLAKSPSSLDIIHSGYVKEITSTTGWFEIPLKVLRDKFLMHSAEKYLSFFGWNGTNEYDLEMLTIIPASHDQEKLLEKVKVISFSPRRLARDIESFLTWFSDYGIKCLKAHPTSESSVRGGWQG
jgi:hypothetical protein